MTAMLLATQQSIVPTEKAAIEIVRQIGRPTTSLMEHISGIETAFTRRYDVPIQKASVVVPPISFTIAYVEWVIMDCLG